MSLTPFRTAFWSLGLGFALVLLLALPNPQKIQFALRSQHLPPSALPAQPASATAPRMIAAADRSQNESPARPFEMRVASADPGQQWGLFSDESFPKTTNSRALPERTSPNQAAHATPTRERNIPVPEPERPTGAAAVTEIEEDNWTALPERPALSRHEPRPVPELPLTPSPSATTPADSLQAAKTTQPHSPSLALPVTIATAEPVQPVTESTPTASAPDITFIAGETATTWHITFRKIPLQDLLKTLGRRAGWNVMIEGELTDLCSGEFEEIEPAQAFAVMIKLHHCTVSRRGQSLLVEQNTAERYR